MPTVLAFVEAQGHVCCRYRLLAFQTAMLRAGYELRVVALPRSLPARLGIFAQAKQAHVVILQRKLLSWPEVAWLRRCSRRLIFDFDDAVWLRDSFSPKGFKSRKRWIRFQRTVRTCDAIVAGNRFLADELPAKVHGVVIPTCVSPRLYPLAEHTRSGTDCKLIWLGSSSTLQGLERHAELLNGIGRAFPGLRLTVVCDRFPKFADLPVDAVPWSEATETSVLAFADIGLGWVPDDPWSRGKCGLKLLQYQAAGLAVVANPVGVQADIVQHGVSGFLTDGLEEWIRAIRQLVADRETRRAFGRAGRQQVERLYSVEVGAAKWLALLREMK